MRAGVPPPRAVMADVAAQTGISIMTASRVPNGFPGVNDETRLRRQGWP
jgi:DNA-binding LacI/PurR family transcriptional regulator